MMPFRKYVGSVERAAKVFYIDAALGGGDGFSMYRNFPYRMVREGCKGVACLFKWVYNWPGIFVSLVTAALSG